MILSFHTLNSFLSYSVMMKCWLESSDERPCFSKLVQIFNRALEPLADYLDFTQNFINEWDLIILFFCLVCKAEYNYNHYDIICINRYTMSYNLICVWILSIYIIYFTIIIVTLFCILKSYSLVDGLVDSFDTTKKKVSFLNCVKGNLLGNVQKLGKET